MGSRQKGWGGKVQCQMNFYLISVFPGKYETSLLVENKMDKTGAVNNII